MRILADAAGEGSRARAAGWVPCGRNLSGLGWSGEAKLIRGA